MSRNRHDDNILIYCFSGKGFLRTSDWSGEIQSGELALLPRGVSHRYWANADDPWSIYWCHFSGHQAQEYVFNMDYKKQMPILKIGHSPQLMAQFASVLAESSTGYNTPAMIYAANMLKQLLAYIGKLAQQVNTPERQQFNLDILQAYMLQNLNKSIDLDALAKQVNLSKFHFSKKYKEATGFSPVQHFLKMKVEYASYLLETSELAIQGIASRVGYDDSLYFSRLFKKHTGLSPSEYRKLKHS
nr:AraC family transcriptional regulator [Aliiglaciecola lipolytica]